MHRNIMVNSKFTYHSLIITSQCLNSILID